MHIEQANRIIKKLELARITDKDLNVFGANVHKYKLGKTISPKQILSFEKKYAIQLPDCYKTFLLHIGHSGPSYAKSAAGPAYGIYPLGENINELIDTPERYLGLHAVITPSMTNEEWETLTYSLINDDDISDDEYQSKLCEVYSGLLPLGSQGCTYLQALVVSGKYSGRVVNISTDLDKPTFCFEKNFLDWYERWLDEIISGTLLNTQSYWFGYSMGGNDTELLDIFDNAQDEQTKIDALNGLNKLKTASNQSCNRLALLLNSENRLIQHIAASMLTKFSYHMATNALETLIDGDDTDCLIACKSILWYAKNRSGEWVSKLSKRVNTVNNKDTFTYITYILVEAKIDYAALLIPFCSHESEDIRVTAYYSLGKLINKTKLVNQFIIGLSDKSARVVHTTLQALTWVKDPSLLPAYLKIIATYKTDEDYILTNLEYRLKEMGFSGRADFVKRFKPLNETSC